MKKTLFFGTAIIALLTACSSEPDEPEMKQSNTIGFNAIVTKSTRANDILTSNLKEFSVYGIVGNSEQTNTATLFDGTTVSLSGTSWTYSPLRYWTTGNDYMFAAIAPLNYSSTSGAVWEFTPPESITEKATGMGTITFSNALALANQDLVYSFAQVNDATATPDPVAFTFNHLLSRVRITFNNDFQSAGSYIKISEVMVYDIISNATIDMSAATPAWTPAGGASFSRLFPLETNIGVEFNNESSAKTYWYYFIPANQEYKVSFVVELYSGTENGAFLAAKYVKSCTLPAVDMQPGYSYNFVASINENNISETPLQAIRFTVTDVTSWNDWSDGGNATF